MNTSRRLHSRKRPFLISIRKVLRLQSAITLLLAFLLYTAVSEYLFTPRYIEIHEDEGSYSFLSTDCKDPVRSSLEHAIRNAKESVVLIIYSLSDTKVTHALRDAAARGVDVCIIHDPVETPDCAGLVGKAAKCYPRRSQGLMHNKLLVIDHTNVWLGSANMSTRSLTEQGNLILALRSQKIAESIEALATSMISHSTYPRPPLTVQLSESSLTLYFHPFHGNLAFTSLVERIDKASKRVFVAMFTFTHPDLVSALCRAKTRGVDVRVILDKDSSNQTSRKSYIRLQREKIPCGYRTKPGLLHYKAAIIDNSLIAGSCNWTKAGFTSNHEAMLFIDPLSSSQLQWVERWWECVEHYSSMQLS